MPRPACGRSPPSIALPSPPLRRTVDNKANENFAPALGKLGNTFEAGSPEYEAEFDKLFAKALVLNAISYNLILAGAHTMTERDQLASVKQRMLSKFEEMMTQVAGAPRAARPQLPWLTRACREGGARGRGRRGRGRRGHPGAPAQPRAARMRCRLRRERKEARAAEPVAKILFE